MTGISSVMFAVKTAFKFYGAYVEMKDKSASRFDIEHVFKQRPETDPFAWAAQLLSDDSFWTNAEEHQTFCSEFESVLYFDEKYKRRSIRVDIDPDDAAMVLQALKRRFPAQIGDDEEDVRLASGRFVLSRWADKDVRNRARSKVIWSLTGSALEFLSLYSGRLGLQSQAENIVSAITSGLSAHIEHNLESIAQKPIFDGLASRVAEVLLTTSLEMAESRPELFAEEKPVQLAIQAFMSPLYELNQTNSHMFGLKPAQRIDRIRSTLRGPVAAGLLQTLHDQRREIFEDYPEKEKAAGIVSDALFKGMVDDVSNSGTVYSLFSPGFVNRVYPTVLQAVSENPAAFVRGKGLHVEAGQEFLSKITSSLQQLEKLKDPKFAQSIFEMGIDISRRYTHRFLVLEAEAAVSEWRDDELAKAKEPWVILQINLVSHIANGVIDGFEESKLDLKMFSRPVEQDYLLELVGIIAEQVAATPGMLVGDEANPEVIKIAKGVARFVANKHANLLTRADWQLVSAKAVELALENPGKLFGLQGETLDSAIAVNMIERMLETAHASFIGLSNGASELEHKKGRVLFGRTLRDALLTTLELSASHARSLTDPSAQKSLMDFAEQLNRMALDESIQLSSKDWLLAFSWFGADVIETGDLAMTEPEILNVLKKLQRGEAISEQGFTLANVERAQVLTQVSPAAGSSVDVNVSTTGSYPSSLPKPLAIDGASSEAQEVYYEPVSAEGAQG